MSMILWAGSLLGLIIGSIHAVYLYRRRIADARKSATDSTMAHVEGVYYGLWALVLWVIFGSYVLVLWVIAVVACGITRIVPGRRTA